MRKRVKPQKLNPLLLLPSLRNRIENPRSPSRSGNFAWLQDIQSEGIVWLIAAAVEDGGFWGELELQGGLRGCHALGSEVWGYFWNYQWG